MRLSGGVGIMGRWRIGVLFLLFLAAPAWAVAEADLPPLPWTDDLTLTTKVMSQLRQGDIKAMAPFAQKAEAALKRARAFFPDGVVVGGKRYMLVDGDAEIEIAKARAKALAKSDGTAGEVVPLGNFYALLGSELGVYYDEVGRIEDGIRVLDQTLALSPDPVALKGQMMGGMLSEKGFALGHLKHYGEAMLVYDKALTIPTLSPRDRARLYRGKGFLLTETDRLDDALAAYRESLKAEPNNPGALNEIDYIERLKAGGSKVPAITVLPHDRPTPASP